MIKVVIVIRNSIFDLSVFIFLISFFLMKNICLLKCSSIANHAFDIDRDDFILDVYFLNTEESSTADFKTKKIVEVYEKWIWGFKVLAETSDHDHSLNIFFNEIVVAI
jgi:hypothetical protein